MLSEATRDVCPMHRSSQNNLAVPSSHDSCTGAQTSESRRTCTEAESSVPFFTGMIISSFAANANILFSPLSTVQRASTVPFSMILHIE